MSRRSGKHATWWWNRKQLTAGNKTSLCCYCMKPKRTIHTSWKLDSVLSVREFNSTANSSSHSSWPTTWRIHSPAWLHHSSQSFFLSSIQRLVPGDDWVIELNHEGGAFVPVSSDFGRKAAVCEDGFHDASGERSTVQAAVFPGHRYVGVDERFFLDDVIGLVVVVGLLQFVSLLPEQGLPHVDLRSGKHGGYGPKTRRHHHHHRWPWLTLMKSSMFRTLVSLFPFFSLSTRTSSMLAPTLWPISARRVCSSDTE